MKEISERLKEYDVQALLIIGGFEVKYLLASLYLDVTKNIYRLIKQDCNLRKLE